MPEGQAHFSLVRALMKTSQQLLLNFLHEHSLTIAFAESMTCGMAAARMGNVSGASKVFAGSIVCYDESVKMDLLKIPRHLIKKFTAESQPITDSLAKSLKRLVHSDIQVAITGLASPGGTETKNKPVGTIFIAVLVQGKLYRLRKRLSGSPSQIKRKACDWLFTFTQKKIRRHY